MTKTIKNEILGGTNWAIILVLIFSIFSFFYNTDQALAVDTTAPTVDITYTKNPTPTGTNKITATYSEAVTTAPNISIDQPGSTDINNTSTALNTPGGLWVSRTASRSDMWSSITYGNGLFVAVTSNINDNKIMTSPDGITWTTVTAIQAGWTAVTYGNGLFVAVATSGTNKVMTSPDGITWTARLAAEANAWRAVTYGNGLFVAVSDNGTNRVMTSPDGITWTPRMASAVDTWYSIAYGNGTFVAGTSAGSSTRMMTSSDGITWTSRTSFSSNNGWRSLTYGNGLFVGVSPSFSSFITSPNGINWTLRSTGVEFNFWSSVTYGNGLFVVVASTGTNRIATSPDGITWTARTASKANDWNSVTYGNGLFVALCNTDTDGGKLQVMTSSDFSYSYDYVVNVANGSTYIDGTSTVALSEVVDLAGNTATAPTHNTFVIESIAPTVALSYSLSSPVNTGTQTITANYSEIISGSPTISIDQPGTFDVANAPMIAPGGVWSSQTASAQNSWKSVTYGNGTFVAISISGTNKVMTSPDGITWTARLAAEANSWQSITYGNGLFVAVAYDGTNRVMTSPDGITWTARLASEANQWRAVTYGNGLFVAVAETGTNRVMTSPDGITWSARTAAGALGWIAVSYGNGTFVAVASGTSVSSLVMTSPDGVTWTMRNFSTSSSYAKTAITFGNGVFIVVGNNSSVDYSTDGINWLSRVGWFYNKTSVVYGNGFFVATANSGANIVTSPDGITWTPQMASETNTWNSVAYGNGTFVAVASSGTNRVMTSPGNYSYNYIVSKANGGTYIDGTATVSLSSVTDLAGNISGTPTNTTFTIDTSGSSVNLTYSASIAKAGENIITATYIDAPTTTPMISINQPGTTDITNVPMSGSGTVWTYIYTVNTANGSTYIDGRTIVSLSTTTNAGGSFSQTPFNNIFIIDTTAPTATISFSTNPTKAGTETMQILYSEEIIGTPTISIDQPGSTDIVNDSILNNSGATWTANSMTVSNTWKSVTYGNGLFVAVAIDGTNRVMTSPNGITWTSRIETEANSWNSVTYGNGLFVAVASTGTNRVMTSPDGITWTPQMAPEANPWQRVTYGDRLFVAVASSGTNRIMTSPDGITWTPRMAPEANNWYSLAYGNGLFVVGATTGTNKVMTSPDGITWTARSTGGADYLYSIVYGNGLFVASSYGKVITSPDGITWTDRTTPELNAWISITYGNGLFVAAATNGTNRIITSLDGINWTLRSVPSSTLNSVTYGNGIFVSVSGNGANPMTSPAFTYSYPYQVNQADGSTYVDGVATVNLSSNTDLAGNTISSLTGNTFFIDTTSPSVDISYSKNPAGTGVNTVMASYSEVISSTPTISINQPGTTDISNGAMVTPGSTWTPRVALASDTMNNWKSIVYGNGLFVAVADSGNNKVMTSPDGITWTARVASEANLWNGVIYGNGLFVAVASSGTNRVMTSPDGITWTARVASEANQWMAVTYGNGLFVAVANTGTNRVMTSPDGINWTSQMASEVNSWRSVTYGNGLFVAVASSGTNKVMTSPDGITWTARAGSGLNYWYSVTYGNGIFVAVVYTGTARTMRSTDGINWTIVSGGIGSLQSVTYGDGFFVAVSGYAGGTNHVMTSPDGLTWTARSTIADVNYHAVAYGNGLFVAVAQQSYANQVITSPSGYTYNYTVNADNGTTYVDGTTTVSLSATTDLVGNIANAPTNNTFEINTAPPTVALTYSKSTAGVGTNIITATYSKPVLTAPNISINQSGTTDISSVAMTGSGATYTYDYTVSVANGTTYADGVATVSLSTVMDDSGNSSASPTNETFNIETVPPTYALTYSIAHAVKSGDVQTITATFSEPMADTPLPQISISGVNTLPATDMTKVDSTHFTYAYTVGAGNGLAIVSIGGATDVGINPMNIIPTSGADFTLDNIAPTGTISTICSTLGNGCTTLGQSATPEEAYNVQSIVGTSLDEEGGSSIGKIEISIKDTITNKWYSGTSFVDETETYILATGAPSWSYDASLLPLVINHTYAINAKIFDVAENSQVISLNFKFTNAPPVVTNVTASQDLNGVVSVSYDVTDIESTQTTNYLFYKTNATLSGSITGESTSMTVSEGTYLKSTGTIMLDDEIITYTSKAGNVLNGLTRGVLNTTPMEHTASDVYILATSATGSGIGLSNIGTGKSITWLAQTDADGFESSTGIIKVVANDGSVGSMIGSLASTPFALDAKKPTALITFDAGVAGLASSATITIPKPIDISAVEYKISDDESTQTNPTNTGWVSITEDTTIPWTFDSDIEIKNLKYQFRDVYGNVSSEEIISTHTPIPSSSFMVQDTSNISASSPYYDMYIGWQSTEALGFSSYKLEYATSMDNITYNAYSNISDDSLSNIDSNYYFHRNLTANLFYRYRLGVLDTNGNISVRSNSFSTTKTDGVQNYDEGGGGSVSTASKVENVVVTQNEDKTVTIDYKLTDTSISKKVNPSYEAYLFYNIGISIPEDALVGNTLAVTDASKLKPLGYIQVNNEVIKYTGIVGNVLTGIVRSTWPTDISSGRTTRNNPTFFSGTPVFIMASGATPNTIVNDSLSAGQNNSIVWNTFSEINLAGASYPNTGIKVLVHDNQDALSGPLSSQNDFSENGILNNLDLTAPTISFGSTTGTGVESLTPGTLTINLARAYPLPVTVNYTLTGTATSGDYTLVDGVATIASGETTSTIEIPIVNDTLKELDETIILTLSSPENATLGTDIVYSYTITDDDNSSGIQFDSTGSTGLESVTSVLIPISLSEISGADTTVTYTIGGTATSTDDYTLINGTATILAGELSANITLPIVNDILKEESETIILTLSLPVNATLGTNTVYTYTVEDNDLFPTLEFNAVTSEGIEDVNTVDIPISISTPYAEDISFDYSVTSGTAEGTSIDYLLDSGSITIGAGETTANINIVIFDDDISEETETIIITLSAPLNAILGTNIIHAYSILDNEIAVTEISGSSIRSTSARISWTTADFTDSLVEYGTIAPGGEGAYNLSKSNTEKVLEHNIYLGNLIPSTKYYVRTTSVNLASETTVVESDFTTTAGPIISSVISNEVSDTGAVIFWTTDIPTSSYVVYSTDSGLSTPTRFGSPELVLEHFVTLTNTNSDALYYYLVEGTDTDGNVGEDANDGDYYNFTTLTDQTAPVISDIGTPIITSNQVAVVWKTNELSDGKVMYSTTTGSYGEETTLIETKVINHLATLSDLAEDTNYYYVIVSTDERGNTTTTSEQTFKTTTREKVYISSGGGGIVGVAQELYDILLAENTLNKAKLKTLDENTPTVSNIKINDITAFGATIVFETSEETISFIDYGKDDDYGLMAADKNWSKNHSIKLFGLTLGTEYSFKINAMDKSNNIGSSDNQTFTTKFLSEDLAELKKIENIEQFQAEIESTIESILPSLVPPFIDKPVISDITESSAVVTFRTNIKSYPALSYTMDSNYDKNKENPYDGEISDTTGKDVSHTLSLIGLKPNTKYHIMVKAFSLPQVIGKSDDFTFTTSASKIRGSVIDIKKDSFVVVWGTDEKTTSIVEYKNLKTGRVSRIVDDIQDYSHSFKIENLSPGTAYQVSISGVNSKGNLVEGGAPINIKTSTDNTSPLISNLKVESSIITGRTDRVQTIVSWTTDEPSTSTIYYEEGTGVSTKSLANKQEDFELTKNHVVILTVLKTGTVYRFMIDSTDDANNKTLTPVRTIITPKKTESIVDVIFKNFDETFNFVNNVR